MIKIAKRSGALAQFDKSQISEKISSFSQGLAVDVDALTDVTCRGIHNGMTTSAIDQLVVTNCKHLAIEHPDYSTLALRLSLDDYQKNTTHSFCDFMQTNKHLFHPVMQKFIYANAAQLDEMIDHSRDHLLTYLGFSIAQRSKYINPGERIQFMFMRAAIQTSLDWSWSITQPTKDDQHDLSFRTPDWSKIPVNKKSTSAHVHHGLRNGKPWKASAYELEQIKSVYDVTSTLKVAFATPTFCSSCDPRPQLCSCFLLGVADSTHGIKLAELNAAKISKDGGGMSQHWHDVRGRGSILNNNGKAGGVASFQRSSEATILEFDQRGRRPGASAQYIAIHHIDLLDVIRLKRAAAEANHTDKTNKLDFAVWMRSLFLERERDGGNWSFFSPDEAPGLDAVYGEQYRELYLKYEGEGRARLTLPAREVAKVIYNLRSETGEPYIVNADWVNLKSNQQNIGTIRSSNLCCEIVQYSSATEYATCTLGSIAVANFLMDGWQDESISAGGAVTAPYGLFINWPAMGEAVRTLVRCLDNVIDNTVYPVWECVQPAFDQRALGIGVQGFATLFARLRIAFDSPEACALSRKISEWIYYNGMLESAAIAEYKGSYPYFEGSPISEGRFQFDLWKECHPELASRLPESSRPSSVIPAEYSADTEDRGSTVYAQLPHTPICDWATLRERVKQGVRHSQIIARMPTQTISSVYGQSFSFEVPTKNIYLDKSQSGEFVFINTEMIAHLVETGDWTRLTQEEKKKFVASDMSDFTWCKNGDTFARIYKTAAMMDPVTIVDIVADDAPYVDQSSSFNHYISDNKVNTQMFAISNRAEERGLKTQSYYTRVSVTKRAMGVLTATVSVDPVCTREEGCLSCQ
jgi:ribonucleoside-diphosphate reductase alpha subunit